MYITSYHIMNRCIFNCVHKPYLFMVTFSCCSYVAECAKFCSKINMHLQKIFYLGVRSVIIQGYDWSSTTPLIAFCLDIPSVSFVVCIRNSVTLIFYLRGLINNDHAYLLLQIPNSSGMFYNFHYTEKKCIEDRGPIALYPFT